MAVGKKAPAAGGAAQLEYEVVEDSFDDTTHIRTLTEQALVKGRGWLIRTTLYTPHHIASSVTFLADKAAKGELFKPLGM